jgi:hypothetical protein
MAQSGNFTPILLYGSSTPTNVPLAANLTNSAVGSEIAINVADKNLFFKDSGGTVNTVPIRQSSTSSNGWLSSTDWNTFNGKAPATSGTSLLYGNGSGGFSNVTIGTGITFAGGTLSATGSGGTVTSVTGTSPVVSSGGTTPAISLATAYGDTLNPYASKTANYILAAPNGSAGVPTFRALVAADLPSLSGTYIPYTGASSAIDLNAKTVVNIANLGINTTSVPTILIRAIGDNNSGSRIAMRGYSSNTSSSAIRVTKFRGTFASPQAPLSGDSLGKFELAGYGTTSSDGYPQASYEGVATENWGATARGTKTLFYTTPNTTTTQTLALTLNQDQTATFVSSVTANGVLLTGNTGTVTSVAATAGTGISISGSPITTSGTLTVTNTAPDQTVVLTAGTGISTSGTYPNFTITNTSPSSGGTVTSVTGTSPVVSSGGTTPAISMPAATTSVSGYLTSTDWNTFNNKGSGTVTSVSGTTGRITSTGGATPVIDLASGVASAGTTGSSTLIPVVTIDTYGRVTSITTAANPQGTVTSVTGTAPVVSSGGATPAISMAAATTSVNGYLTSTDWTTFNGKAPSVTFTTGYVPFGQGTTTLNQESVFFWDTTNKRLGLGTSSPALTLHVFKGSSGATSPTNIAGIFENSAASGIAFLSPDANASRIYFGTPSNNQNAYIYADYNAGAQTLIFGVGSGATAATEKMRLFASGGVSIGNTTDAGANNLSVTGTGKFGTTIGVGAATPAASGAGITFPATQSDSSNANTLDDYEEGTWTPSLTFGGGSTGITYISGYQNGTYTKIGNLVTVSCVLYPSSIGTSIGTANITGLPFSCSSTDGSQAAAAVLTYGITSTGTIGAAVSLSSTSFNLYTTSATGTVALLTNTNFSAYCYINLTVSYRTA